MKGNYSELLALDFVWSYLFKPGNRYFKILECIPENRTRMERGLKNKNGKKNDRSKFIKSS